MAALIAMGLEMRDVTYRYAGSAEPALRGVSLTLERGRVVGVVGGNGSGKSTLCLVAAGLAPLTIGGQLEGTVAIDGLATSEARQHEVAVRVGILFQDPDTQLTGSTASVWEEVAFGPRNLALPVEEVVERTWGAVEDLEIGHIVERDPGRLSGGQAQLVALASVIALRPQYLILDEPTSQLDPEGTRLVSDALRRAAERTGAGVLVVEHRTDLLEQLCDEVVVMADGAVTLSGPASAVLDHPQLERLGVTPPARVRLRRAVSAAGPNWNLEDWL